MCKYIRIHTYWSATAYTETLRAHTSRVDTFLFAPLIYSHSMAGQIYRALENLCLLWFPRKQALVMHHVFRPKTFSTAAITVRVLMRSSRRCSNLMSAVNANTFKNYELVSNNWNRTFTTAQKQDQPVDNEQQTFEDLFKASKFVDMLDPVGKIVDGKIIAVDGPNLYIDFGCKFHGVAIRPHRFSERYIKGARVKVLIKDLEVGMHFLGSNTDTSLLEASIEIVGLL